MEAEITSIRQEERIKLERNSRGYNWELFLIPMLMQPSKVNSVEELKEINRRINEADIERLEHLNTIMMNKFGSLSG